MSALSSFVEPSAARVDAVAKAIFNARYGVRKDVSWDGLPDEARHPYRDQAVAAMRAVEALEPTGLEGRGA